MRQIRPKWQGLGYWNFKQWILVYFCRTWNQSPDLLCIHGFSANISNRIITLTHYNPQHWSNFSLTYLLWCFASAKSCGVRAELLYWSETQWAPNYDIDSAIIWGAPYVAHQAWFHFTVPHRHAIFVKYVPIWGVILALKSHMIWIVNITYMYISFLVIWRYKFITYVYAIPIGKFVYVHTVYAKYINNGFNMGDHTF